MIRKINIKVLQLLSTGLKKEKELAITGKEKKMPLIQEDFGKSRRQELKQETV